MEIEAKLIVPDEATFRRLTEAADLAGYSLSPGQTSELHDTYLDTAAEALWAAGYAYRQREVGGDRLATLKSVGLAADGVHRREELEARIPPAADGSLPPSPVRERLLELTDDAVLVPLVELRQARTARQVTDSAGRRVAELALDEVRFESAMATRVELELEVELAEDGRDEDLSAISTCLREAWGLQPQPRSKFERAREFSTAGADRVSLLAPAERRTCVAIWARDDLHGRRARALLALDEGVSQADAGELAGMSTRRVRYWLAAFRGRRLAVFPDRVLASVPAGEPGERVPEPAPPAELPPLTDEEPAEEPVALLVPPPPVAVKLLRRPGLRAGDRMPEAARKTFGFHFRRMLAHEAGTRAGEDIEELHDMRVATRRMRAAYDVFHEYLDRGTMAPFAKGLRRTGRALGRVRDLDVFWEKTQAYLDHLPADQQDGLHPLRAVWEVERESSRARMIAYLDGDRYASFTREFGAYLENPGASAPPLDKDGEPQPSRLRHVVPVVVYRRLAAVRAYDEWVTRPKVPLERLHRLRIAAKGLRYALEFFREVLGPEARDAIGLAKGLQDHLGDLHDAVVASGLLRDFLVWGKWGHSAAQVSMSVVPEEPILAPGVATYLANRQTELQRLVATFPTTWDTVRGRNFSALVASALAVL